MGVSPPSPAISDSKKRFGAAEMDYLMRLAPALQNPAQPSTVKMWLGKAQRDGLAPRRIYEAAVSARPPHWTPAPAWDEVDPNRSQV